MTTTQNTIKKIEEIRKKAHPQSLLEYAVENNATKLVKLMLTHPSFEKEVTLGSIKKAEAKINDQKFLNSSLKSGKNKEMVSQEIKSLIIEKKVQLLEDKFKEKNTTLLKEAVKRNYPNIINYCLRKEKSNLNISNKKNESSKGKETAAENLILKGRSKLATLLIWCKLKNKTLDSNELARANEAAKEVKNSRLSRLLTNLRVRLIGKKLEENSSKVYQASMPNAVNKKGTISR